VYFVISKKTEIPIEILLKKFFNKKIKLLLISDIINVNYVHEFHFSRLLFFFAVMYCGGNLRLFQINPINIRRIMMENLVKCLVRLFAKFPTKSQMLKWASRGGGG
jgi:hypothetical protein